jgi:hypothetical protein
MMIKTISATLATLLILATSPAGAQFRAGPTHGAPPEYMVCGIVSQTKDDSKPTDTIYSINLQLGITDIPETNITSFDVYHNAVDGSMYRRSDQYEGALAWDKKTHTLTWQGKNKKHSNVSMSARLKPYNEKLWSYEEVLIDKGRTAYKMFSICHVSEIE